MRDPESTGRHVIDDAVTGIEVSLSAKVRMPQHVVYRSFPAETVVLNLQTGKYHGLNATAGRMLAELESQSTVGDAATALAEVYGQPAAVLQGDLLSLCRNLLERGLLEREEGGDVASET